MNSSSNNPASLISSFEKNILPPLQYLQGSLQYLRLLVTLKTSNLQSILFPVKLLLLPSSSTELLMVMNRTELLLKTSCTSMLVSMYFRAPIKIVFLYFFASLMYSESQSGVVPYRHQVSQHIYTKLYS